MFEESQSRGILYVFQDEIDGIGFFQFHSLHIARIKAKEDEKGQDPGKDPVFSLAI